MIFGIDLHQCSKNIAPNESTNTTIPASPLLQIQLEDLSTLPRHFSLPLFVIFWFFWQSFFSAGCHNSSLYLPLPIIHSSMLGSSSECYGRLLLTLRRVEQGKSAQQLFLIRHLLGSDGAVIKGLVMFGYTRWSGLTSWRACSGGKYGRAQPKLLNKDVYTLLSCVSSNCSV